MSDDTTRSVIAAAYQAATTEYRTLPTEMGVVIPIDRLRHRSMMQHPSMQPPDPDRVSILDHVRQDETALWRDIAERFYEAHTKNDMDLLKRAIDIYEREVSDVNT